MACAAPGGGVAGGGDDPNDRFDPPKTPRMVLKDDACDDELSPDTEDNVAEQTDGIFRNFVFNMQTLGRRGAGRVGGATPGDVDGAVGGDDTPSVSLPELTAFADQPMS